MKFAPLAIALVLLGVAISRAEEVLPPKPDRYFNDYASVVSKDAALRFNEQLAQFERETSNQVLVAVFPKMQSESEIADYTQRVAESWGVGRGANDNGAVLFVFINDRKMYIQVGYGLEGVLPDVTAFDITERQIKPKFRTGNYEAGLATGIELMMKAIRGEYTGTGKTLAEGAGGKKQTPGWVVFVAFFFMMFVLSIFRRRRRSGWGYSGTSGPFIGGWGGGGGGWSGGSSGGGFSGFSGGGGGFGGGGGGSSW